VLDLSIQNEVLLPKNLHKFFNRLEIPWVKLVWNSYYNNGQIPRNHMEGSIWWKAHLKLLDKSYQCKSMDQGPQFTRGVSP
jgi:hypothetical protein